MPRISIRAARADKRMTQADVAKLMGISVPTYARIENDPETVTLGRARALAEIFGRSLDDLLYEGDDSSEPVVEAGDHHA